MLNRFIYRALLSGGIAFGGLLCGGCTKVTETETIRQVTVSIAPLEYFIRNIGGDSISVNTLMEAGGDPETFQPGMGVMRELSRSGNLLVTGVLPFENKLAADIKGNASGLILGVAGEGIEYMYGTHSHGDIHSHGPEVAGEEGEPDPHIWGSLRNARIMAANTLRFLKNTYPELSDYLDGRYASLCVRLDSIDKDFSERLRGVDAFVIWHPSLSYFARDYGMEQIALNPENKETSPLRLKEAAEQAVGHSVKAFFIPEGFPRNRVATLSDAMGVEPTEVNFMDADPERQLRAVVDALTSNNAADGE